MKNIKFKAGTVITGKDLKGYMLCKILPADMVMQGFRYKDGMNKSTKTFTGKCKAELCFFLARDICSHLNDGTRLALVSVPDEEDVYVSYGNLSACRIVIEKILPLDRVLSSAEGWESLILNGADITADDTYAVIWAARNGYLEAVKFLHRQGVDITDADNFPIILAAMNGHLEVVKYLYEHGADITAGNNEAVRYAKAYGHMDVVDYLRENMK